MTATAMMQLVDEGLVALDDPVVRWIGHVRPDVQVHHLLSHASGIDATDVFIDTGDDDGATARYLALDEVRGAGSVFEPGETSSYNNAGMVMAGHVVSLVRGATYEEAVQRHVFDRAGMSGAGVAHDAAVAFMSPFGQGINAVNPLLDARGDVDARAAKGAFGPSVASRA